MLVPMLWMSRPRELRGKTTTDATGRFVVTGRGYRFDLYPEKQGFIAGAESAVQPYHVDVLKVPKQDREHPMVYHMSKSP